MNRINAQGLNLIEYKKELNKNYSLLVQDALLLALQRLIDEKRLDEETLGKIRDTKTDIQTFSRYLLSRKEYTKNTKELLAEFEKVRHEINAQLIGMGFVENVSTESIIDKNIIAVLKTYTLPQDFVLNYFGIKENQLEQLMKKKGFIEKFAVLRMTKVCKEICFEAPQDRYITQAQSLVYFDKKIQSFSIDYRYNLNVDYIAQPQNTRPTLEKIKEIDDSVEKLFLSKMGIDQYTIETMVKSSLQDELQRVESDSYRKRKELTLIDNKETEPDIEDIKDEHIENDGSNKTIQEEQIFHIGKEAIEADIPEEIEPENIDTEEIEDSNIPDVLFMDEEIKDFVDPLEEMDDIPTMDLSIDDSILESLEGIEEDDINLSDMVMTDIDTIEVIDEPEESIIPVPSPEDIKDKITQKEKKQKNSAFFYSNKK